MCFLLLLRFPPEKKTSTSSQGHRSKDDSRSQHTRSLVDTHRTRFHTQVCCFRSFLSFNMRSTLIFAAVTAVGFVDAASRGLVTTSLFRRQAFDPSESTGTGATCVEAFGPGYVECVPETADNLQLCINPNLGETCCDSKCTCPAYLSSYLSLYSTHLEVDE